MGRWTPLILMAGGVAILLGTLLGINFPMGGQQTANVPQGRKASSVLPANINVNSAANGKDSENISGNESETSSGSNSTSESRRTSVAQGNFSTETTNNSSNTTQETSGSNDSSSSTNETDTTQSNSSASGNEGQKKEPIRALW
ncbi:hypothetical protein [Aphanizomenon sp. UHCC 0183]|uniref:hypothetical protein n=1 Tax=Aphanizomenon sp. UHCC 0183 TaxID=2590028 RepID=UPI001447E793|nr:hypothetical protein [Aphanizomenon sp. UHCC 0183]MTJ32184.1 hypothetical protein [Aphanizomenon sp. UHCC 0183]